METRRMSLYCFYYRLSLSNKIPILFIIFKTRDENKSIDIDLSFCSFSYWDCQFPPADKQPVQTNELHENDEWNELPSQEGQVRKTAR